jgi:hypothetical protein
VVLIWLERNPDTSYWHQHIATHADVYFLKSRLRHGEHEQAALTATVDSARTPYIRRRISVSSA